MKKKLILKIILDVVLLICSALLIYNTINIIKNISFYLNVLPNKIIITWIINAIGSLFAVFINLLFLIVINLKGFKYLTESIIKSMHEKKESTSKERKQKRIEELEKELNALKKDE